jgi:hypothetical protein
MFKPSTETSSSSKNTRYGIYGDGKIIACIVFFKV